MIVCIFIVLFSDLIRIELNQVNDAQGKNMSQKEIDILVSAGKSGAVFIIIVVIAVDFVIRFLVIDSLYHRFKEEGKPRLNV
jgi:hypothetical protein